MRDKSHLSTAQITTQIRHKTIQKLYQLCDPKCSRTVNPNPTSGLVMCIFVPLYALQKFFLSGKQHINLNNHHVQGGKGINQSRTGQRHPICFCPQPVTHTSISKCMLTRDWESDIFGAHMICIWIPGGST